LFIISNSFFPQTRQTLPVHQSLCGTDKGGRGRILTMIETKKIAALFALSISLTAASGCRFGNYADTPQPIADPSGLNGTISKTELFFTQPTTFETAVFYTDTTPTGDNSQTPLSAIPATTLAIFSNPVYYATMANPANSPAFIGIDGTSFVNTTVDANNNISDEADGDVTPLLTNQNCLVQFQQTQAGSLNTSDPGTFQFSDGTAQVSGHLILDYTSVLVIQAQVTGACDADLTYLAQCYQVGTGCSTAELTEAQSLFDLYVKQAGILNLNNVTKIKALAYTVHFE
jgi:hypothetical protein